MLRRTDPRAPTDPAEPPDPSAAGPDLSKFPVLGLTRRRLAGLVGVLLAAWVVLVFARQVGEAAAATGRAGAMVDANAQQRDQIVGLQRELQMIGQDRYVRQQARAYGLGSTHEIPFTLEAGAPPLGEDAPGSAALRVGAHSTISPLDRWLSLLFGPGGG